VGSGDFAHGQGQRANGWAWPRGGQGVSGVCALCVDGPPCVRASVLSG